MVQGLILAPRFSLSCLSWLSSSNHCGPQAGKQKRLCTPSLPSFSAPRQAEHDWPFRQHRLGPPCMLISPRNRCTGDENIYWQHYLASIFHLHWVMRSQNIKTNKQPLGVYSKCLQERGARGALGGITSGFLKLCDYTDVLDSSSYKKYPVMYVGGEKQPPK